jgi:hypothetical protein
VLDVAAGVVEMMPGRWGIPIPRIRITVGDNDRALLRQQVRGSCEMAEYRGYKIDFWSLRSVSIRERCSPTATRPAGRSSAGIP